MSQFNFAVDIVDKLANSNPNLRAMLWTNNEDTKSLDLSYKYFSRRSHLSAQMLYNLGAKKGDRVMMMLPRVPAW